MYAIRSYYALVFSLELNLFTLMLVGTLLAASSRRQALVYLSARLYFSLLALIGTLIALESVRSLIVIARLPGGDAVGNAVNAAYFALEGALYLRYFTFIDFHVFGDTLRTRRLARRVTAVWLAYSIPVVLSAFTGWVFSVGPDGHVIRGPLFAYIPVFSYAVLGAGLLRAFQSRSRVERRNFWPLFVFPLPTIVGGTVQLLNARNNFV